MSEAPSRIVVGKETKVRAIPPEAFGRIAALGLMAAGLIFMVGSVADVMILWVFQRQPIPQWEFTALASTAEGLPRVALGAALVYSALYIRASTSMAAYRLLGVVLILLGVAGAVVGALMVLDYFTLRATVQPAAGALFKSTVLKTLLLSGMFVVLLIPVGIASLRRPRAI